jgi:alkylation response protein AidB-like acyl-CoA dehydrogenase
MPFAFTDEQRDLADGVARLLADRATGLYARQVLAGEASWRDLWAEVAELGVAALLVPEELDGLGLGAVELVAVAEACGRFLAPAPIVATAGSFAPPVAMAGGDAAACLERVLGEGAAATLCHVDPLTRSGAVELDRGRLRVEGLLVPDAERVEYFAFVVEDDGVARVAVVPAAAVEISPVECKDRLRPLGRIRIEAAEAGVGELPAGAAPLAVPFVAAAAELVGMAAEMLRISVEYAGEREQFKTRIGSFQAVKHRLADSLVLVERARSLTYRAAVLAAAGTERRELMAAAHLAKASAGEAAVEVARASVQVHGGVGMTEEHDISLFYLRARQASMMLGGSDAHYRAAARAFLTPGA